MKNLKIGKKLLITFGTIILLYLITILVTQLSMRTLGGNLEEFYKVNYQVNVKTMDMRRAMQRAMKSIALSLHVEDTASTQSYLADADEQLTSVESMITELQKIYPEGKSIMEQVESLMEQSNEYWDQIEDLEDRKQNAEAKRIFFASYAPILDDINQQLMELQDTVTEIADSSFRSSENIQVTVQILVLAIATVAVVITLFLSSYITKGLKKPISEIESAAIQMAEGHLDVMIEYESKDELGVLSNTIRKLADTLKVIISDEAHLLGEMSAGNFDVKTAAEYRYVGDFSAILASLRTINTNLSDTLQHVNESADQVASGSVQVSDGSQALSQGATEQASSIQELAATVTEISSQVKENAQNAEQASQAASQVGEEMEDSNQKMQEMIKAMEEFQRDRQDHQDHRRYRFPDKYPGSECRGGGSEGRYRGQRVRSCGRRSEEPGIQECGSQPEYICPDRKFTAGCGTGDFHSRRYGAGLVESCGRRAEYHYDRRQDFYCVQ